jgi:hypothetical protein
MMMKYVFFCFFPHHGSALSNLFVRSFSCELLIILLFFIFIELVVIQSSKFPVQQDLSSVLHAMEESITKTVNDLDAWIEKLYSCKALTELEIKQLCEKVYTIAVVMLLEYASYLLISLSSYTCRRVMC